jgi:17beta-estradiol 17-dehydrogenase / very-long-chain 3-oxoacyl-CoA reductase
MLVSRTKQRLDETAAEIKASCPSVETATVQFDFSSATEADYTRLAAAVEGKSVGVLYNNVGISYSYAQLLEQLPDDRIDAMVEMNMRAMVKCTKIVLPGETGMASRMGYSLELALC